VPLKRLLLLWRWQKRTAEAVVKKKRKKETLAPPRVQ